MANNLKIQAKYQSPLFNGDAVIFRAVHTHEGPLAKAWMDFISQNITEHEVETRHHDMDTPGPIAKIGTILTEILRGRAGLN